MMNRKRETKTRRRLAPVLLVACLLAAVAAAEPASIAPVFHSSYQAAADAATADQSPVLLIFSAEWCGPCKLLKNKTLSAAEFLHQESPLHVADVDIDAEQKMAKDFAIEAVPTLVLLTADGKIVLRQTGFMEVADLMAWLKDGRARAASGQWEGIAPGTELNEFFKQAAAANLGTNEIQKLIELLGDADPANRDQAGKILLGQRENAMAPLIEAAGNPYLGIRISACELLHRLAPASTPVDPWLSPTETSNAVTALRTWWAATGKLPAAAATPAPGSFSANTVKEALEQLRGDDAVRRTEALTTLVRSGPEALLAVREAIKRAEKNGDQRALGLLEDVRWTILVPDAVEQQSGGVRKVLARGKSSERQAAVERLGGAGRAALGILTELAGDADPLVVESTIRALSGINGGDSIGTLATLLKSTDSNLRMTAAQALGHTKNADAVKPLLEATGDPDEVVACTALAALEETQSSDSYSRTPRALPVEITAGLKRCLADPRWRVRASAAEIAGKLGASGLNEDLKKLLNDPDGFVVKNALTALEKTGSAPEAAQLAGLGERLPSLQGDVTAMMLSSPTDENVKAVSKLFSSGTPEARVAILGAFLRRGFSENAEADDAWQPIFAQAVAAPDPRVRQLAAEVLGRLSVKSAAGLIAPLLADDDRETRQAAAAVVLKTLNENAGGAANTRTYIFPGQKPNKPAATFTQAAAWHTAMMKHPEANPGLRWAAAIYATGDAKTDLPMLLTALNGTNNGPGQSRPERQTETAAIELIVSKLPWPEGRAVLDELATSPIRYAMAASQNAQDRAEVAEYLMEPGRFKAAMEPAAGTDLEDALEMLAGYDYEYRENHTWSLWTETDRTKAVATALIDSTNAAWRAAAVLSLGLRSDAKENLAIFEKAVTDASPWVRASAIRAIARNVKERPALEQLLTPALADTNLATAGVAAVALLEAETRQAAGLENALDHFEFEAVQGGRYNFRSTTTDERPLTVLEGKPVFLQPVRHRLNLARGDDSAPFALLLAQYGDFSGIDVLVAQRAADSEINSRSDKEAVLTGIALSHDNKYVPSLKQMITDRTDESDLRQILQAMKGMSGADARQLRLEINKKIRVGIPNL
jgi:thioredoxin 1